MKWVVRGSGGAHEVTVERSPDGFEVTLDGQRHGVDLIRLNGAVASLRFVEDGRSFHVSYDRGRPAVKRAPGTRHAGCVPSANAASGVSSRVEFP